jgi:hypothetical protein
MHLTEHDGVLLGQPFVGHGMGQRFALNQEGFAVGCLQLPLVYRTDRRERRRKSERTIKKVTLECVNRRFIGTKYKKKSYHYPYIITDIR